MSSKDHTYFNNDCLSDPEFTEWVKIAKSNTQCHCKTCHKMRELSNMGVTALKSHAITHILSQQLILDALGCIHIYVSLSVCLSVCLSLSVWLAGTLPIILSWTLKVSHCNQLFDFFLKFIISLMFLLLYCYIINEIGYH